METENSKKSVNNTSTIIGSQDATEVKKVNGVPNQSKSTRSLITTKVYNTFDKRIRKKSKKLLSKTEEKIQEENMNPRKELKEIKNQLAIQQSNKDMLT